jgi:membrane protein DedA with SNARE-associated domain
VAKSDGRGEGSRGALNGSSLVQLVHDLLRIAPGWYYTILFVAFIAEGTSFPLVHVPSLVMFLASAYLISAGRISLTAAILVAAVGSTIGGFITYRIGRRMSSGAEEAARDGSSGTAAGKPARAARDPSFWTKPDRLRRVQRLVNRYGALFALTARWLGVLRPAALLGTGMARISPWKVVPALFVGSLVYCAFYQFVAGGLETVSLRLLGQVDLPWILLSALGLALVWAAGLLLLKRIRL